MITPTIIRKAQRAAKLYMAINVPLKIKPMTIDVVYRRYSRFTKLFINIFAKDLDSLSNESLQDVFDTLSKLLDKEVLVNF